MAKLSLAAVVLVALVGLGVMAAVGGDVTGAFSAPSKPMAKPLPRPTPAPVRPPVTRDVTVVQDTQPDVVYADYDNYELRTLEAQCWQINFMLDRDAGRKTPASQIPSACPSWI